MADPQLQAVKAQLERRGLSIKADEAQAVQLAGGQQLLIPFGEDAHLVWTRANGQTAAVGLIRQGNKTLNVSADGQERVVRFLPQGKVQKLLSGLRQKSKFQEFEGKLAQKGKRVGKIRVMFDETNKIAILGIAHAGDEERIVHQVRIKVKAGKEDEPEDDAEPAIQATACGQAVGAAVPMGAKLEPLALDPGDGGDLIGSSYDGSEGPDYGPQICTSQWGYDYHCTSRYPMLMVSTSSLALPQTFITQQTQASFVIWNSGGGTLTGTVSVSAPFSIVSGSSFSLLPGQPQEVVVRFSSTTPGSFSKSIGISSNGGNTTVTVTGIAHKVSFSPAQLDFGSGLLVLREQCNNMGVCGLHTEKVGLPIEKTLTVKNEGTVAVTLTLSTAAPYEIVSVLPTLSPGQSGQVTVRFDPNESGNFTGSVQVGIQDGQGSVNSSPLVGVAHKIEIDPAELDFGIVFVGISRGKELTVKNQGMTTVALNISVSAPFYIVSGSSINLAPSESHKLTVWINPVAPGALSANVELANESNQVNVSIKALVYTFAEYVQRFLNSYNQLVQQSGRWGLVGYQSGGTLDRVLLLAGFQDITANQLEEEYQQFFLPVSPSVPSNNQPLDLERAQTILQSIGWQQISNWLQQLAQAMQQGDFPNVCERLISQESSFSRFLEALRLMLPAESATLDVVIEHLKEFVKGRDFSQGLSLEQFQQDFWLEFCLREIFKFYFRRILGLSEAEAQEQANSRTKEFIGHLEAALAIIRAFNEEFQLPWARDPDKEMRDSIRKIIESIWHHVAAYSDRSVPLVNQLEGILRWFENLQLPLSPRDIDRGRELLAAVNATNAFLNEGQPYFSQVMLMNIFGITPEGQLTGDPIGADLQGILTLDITNRVIMDAKIKLRFNDCRGCHETKEQIIAAIRSLVDSLDGCRCGVVGYVFTDPMGASTGLINEIANEFGYFDGALFLVWWESGQLKFTCVGGMCNEMSPTMRRKIACMMAGRRGFCNAQEVYTYQAVVLPAYLHVIVVPAPQYRR
ncbi:MAG: choice-of-anchor D domain-containing protein [Thermofilaceae archaeon]